MIIHEINYQDDDHSNYQERFLSVESWSDYKAGLLGEIVTRPSIKAPEGFVLVEEKEWVGYLRGEWHHPHFTDTKLIHEAHVFGGRFDVINVSKDYRLKEEKIK